MKALTPIMEIFAQALYNPPSFFLYGLCPSTETVQCITPITLP